MMCKNNAFLCFFFFGILAFSGYSMKDDTTKLNVLYKKASDLYFTPYKEREAIEAYSKLLSIYPSHSESWNELSVMQMSINDYVNALKSINKALEVNPKKYDYWVTKDLVLSALNYSLNESHSKHIELAGQAYQAFKNDYELRLDLLNCIDKLLSYSKKLPCEYLDDKASILESLGLYPKAIDVLHELKACISENSSETYLPNINDIDFSIALLYEDSKEYQKSLQVLDKCINEKNEYPLMHKARVLYKLNKKEESNKTLHVLLEKIEQSIIKTKDRAYCFQKISVLLCLSKTEEANDYLSKLYEQRIVEEGSFLQYKKQIEDVKLGNVSAEELLLKK